MSEPTPPFVTGDTLNHTPQPLSDEALESVLADFRSWLRVNASPEPPPADPAPAPDLHTLLGQFVALRHEVNLQTKATRAQQEQNAETLKQLSEALEELRDAEAEEPETDEHEVLRPLLKAMVDVYDNLALAQREVQKVQARTMPMLEELRAEVPAEAKETAAITPPSASGWGRWFGLDQAVRSYSEQVAKREADRTAQVSALQARLRQAAQAADNFRRSQESILTGYGMSLQRLERVLQQQGLDTIPTVGERFDPERMEVVEVVADSGKPAGEVLGEVRRGYFWRGRLFRYAQVRVAK